MKPLVLSFGHLPPRPFAIATRTGLALRNAICITSGSCVLECVREPQGLQFTPGARARRLMRNAQVSAW